MDPTCSIIAGGVPLFRYDKCFGYVFMIKYLIKRLMLLLPTLLGAAVLVFFLLRLVPGDVCEIRLAGTGLYADPAEIELCRKD